MSSRPRLQSLIDQHGVIQPKPSIYDRLRHVIRTFYENLSFLSFVNAILNRFPIIRCTKEYNFRQNIAHDLLSGLTIAVMHIPQGS